MSGFLKITRVSVPRSAVDDAHSFLRHAGLKNCEGFALWVGIMKGDLFTVTETIIPEQTAHISEEGVCVTVDADELHRLNVWLHKQQRLLFCQLHSHPGSAYHSNTDDMFPIATTLGSLSLVIPDFARHPFSLSACATYRLNAQNEWIYLPSHEVARLVTISQ